MTAMTAPTGTGDVRSREKRYRGRGRVVPGTPGTVVRTGVPAGAVTAVTSVIHPSTATSRGLKETSNA